MKFGKTIEENRIRPKISFSGPLNRKLKKLQKKTFSYQNFIIFENRSFKILAAPLQRLDLLSTSKSN